MTIVGGREHGFLFRDPNWRHVLYSRQLSFIWQFAFIFNHSLACVGIGSEARHFLLTWPKSKLYTDCQRPSRLTPGAVINNSRLLKNLTSVVQKKGRKFFAIFLSQLDSLVAQFSIGKLVAYQRKSRWQLCTICLRFKWKKDRSICVVLCEFNVKTLQYIQGIEPRTTASVGKHSTPTPPPLPLKCDCCYLKTQAL